MPHRDWFSSELIHDIIQAVKRKKSSRAAVAHLQEKFPKLPTESEGRFDSLKENTIRHWFDENWELKPQFQYRLDFGSGSNRRGREHVLDRHAEIKQKIIERLKKMRDDDANATVNIDIARAVMMKIVKKYKPVHQNYR